MARNNQLRNRRTAPTEGRPVRPPGVAQGANSTLSLFKVVPSAIAALCLGVLVWRFSLIYGEDKLYRNVIPDSIAQRLLPTLDLLAEVQMPMKPLHEVHFEPAKRYEDTTPYPYANDRAYHGSLAQNFSPAQIPHLTISLDRNFPDFRDRECLSAQYLKPSVASGLPSASVIFIFADEPFETLMRSIHSVLNNTPPSLLKEIILVDDGSQDKYITTEGGLLESYITHLPKVFLTRTGGRSGIMRARTHGILHSTADVFVILDSHIEAQPGWLEPLLFRVNQDPLSFVTPQIDSIAMPNNYKPIRGGIGCHLGVIWRLQDHAFSPIPGVSPNDRLWSDLTKHTSSPVMAGGLFAANKAAFFAAGGYDLQMGAWGAENVELGFRLWMCGARIDCMPCSRVAHIFDRGQTYSGGLGTRKGQDEYNKNRLRTAAIWMDEYAGVAHQILGKPSYSAAGDMSDMFQLRENLQCKSFQWFLENVWPESHIVNLKNDLPFDGAIRPYSNPEACVIAGHSAQVTVRRETELNVKVVRDQGTCPWLLYFPRIGAIAGGFDEEAALYNNRGQLIFDWNRDGHAPNARWSVKYFDDDANHKNHKVVQIQSDTDGKCLTLETKGKLSITMTKCSEDDLNQRWLWRVSEGVLDPKNYFLEWQNTHN